jgi:hypothetical protein
LNPVADFGRGVVAKVAYFGIGSFHFGYTREERFTIGGEEYVAATKTALERVPSISQIQIRLNDQARSREFSSEAPEQIQDRRGIFPDISGTDARIDFDVHLPLRLQAEILRMEEDGVGTHSEDFRVSIHYPFFLPVAFVQTLEPTTHAFGSEGAIAIREFLERELSRVAGPIRFESWDHPFHADCFIRPMDAPDGDPYPEDDWTCRQIPQLGFPDVVFKYNPIRFADADVVLARILDEIDEELSFFYFISQCRRYEVREWTHVGVHMVELTRLVDMAGVRGFLKRTFDFSRQIDFAAISLANYESARLQMSNEIAGYHHDVYSAPKRQCFLEQVDEVMSHPFAAPSEQAARLIDMYERRRANRINIVGFVVASILGGVVGAVLTLLVR